MRRKTKFRWPEFMIVFDIETAPLPDEQIAPFVPEFSAPSNYKDVDKIKSYIEAEKVKWLEQAALSPLTGRVIAVGEMSLGDATFHVVQGFIEPLCTGFADPRVTIYSDEKFLLKWFWSFYSQEVRYDRFFIGFNIFHFDLPFLIRRSLALGVEIPFGIMPACKFYDHQFVDVMQSWQCGDRQQRISLDNYAKFLGVGKKNGEGKDFAKLLKSDPDKAIEYLTNDLWLTHKIFSRVYGNYKPEKKSTPSPLAQAN